MIQRARWLIIAENIWATPNFSADWAFKFVVKMYIRKDRLFVPSSSNEFSSTSRSVIVEFNVACLDIWTETYPPNWLWEAGSSRTLQAVMLAAGTFSSDLRLLRRPWPPPVEMTYIQCTAKMSVCTSDWLGCTYKKHLPNDCSDARPFTAPFWDNLVWPCSAIFVQAICCIRALFSSGGPCLQPLFQQFCVVMAPAAAYQTFDAVKAPEIAMPLFYHLADYRSFRRWAHFCCNLSGVIPHLSNLSGSCPGPTRWTTNLLRNQSWHLSCRL